MTSSKPLIVGAIDFGSTYSGWAFSFFHEFESDPTTATVRQWNNGATITEKTPTCVLIGPDQNFLAFGYEAEDKYKDLVDKGTHQSHYYFRRFKMMLNKKLGEKFDFSTTIEDVMGRSLPAILVFSMAIKYLVEDMIKVGNDRQTGILRKDDVHWVLTVPAIWTDAAKQFMRLAANATGISNDKLTLALEPESASLYCRHLSVDTTVDRSKVSIAKFKVGTKYMILDAGGGTIDITVHEVVSDGQVKEVQRACGGVWGGLLVDKAFEDLIKDIFRPDVYEEFKKKETEDWLDMFRSFDVQKRSITPDSTDRVTIRLPTSLKKIHKTCIGLKVQETNSNTPYKNEIDVTGDKMKFKAKIFQNLFDESIKNTVNLVERILINVQVKAILMVGGFSESPMLQNAIKSEFACEGRDVVIPLSASSSILRGALIYGHCPKSITERVLKYTYGISCAVPFVEGAHPERHQIMTDKGLQCRNIFDKHVEKNQVVRVGEIQVQRIYTPLKKYCKYRTYGIYASTLKNPRFIDEGCEYVGKLCIKVDDPDDDLNREMAVSLTFSGTEIMVEAQDKKTGAKHITYIDFLC